MGKRSNLDKIDKSQYLTPKAAVLPLIPFLPKGGFYFAEPCAGDGRLVRHIEELSHGRCPLYSDIDPELARLTAHERFDGAAMQDVPKWDAFDYSIDSFRTRHIDMVITNPPWERAKKDDYILHRLIEHYGSMIQTWFLFDADWPHTIQAQPYLEKYCTRIVSIGRVKWFPGTGQTGKDNAAWYEFRPDARRISRAPTFYGRNIAP